MKAAVIVLSLIAMTISGTALAQAPDWPNGWIDLQADTIMYDFPYPDTISITVAFSVRSGLLVDSFFVTDMGIFLDGVPVHSSLLEISDVEDICNEKEQVDCYGDCTLQLNPSGSEVGQCRWINDTLFVRCHCRKKGTWSPFSASYQGQTTITFELDMGGSIDEPDEFNNYLSISLVPVAVNPATWGRLKKDYDK